MKRLGFAWVLSSIFLVSCCQTDLESPSGGETVSRLVPKPPYGWTIVQGPTVYDSESLYEYLNGGAPLYLKYGFEKLSQTRFQLGDDPLAAITLDIYDMGSDRGAFGIYRSVLPDDGRQQQWGVEGYGIETIASAWKGHIYIHAEADDDRPQMVRTMEGLVASAASSIQGTSSLPSILRPLPGAGCVERSERWVAADLFGHSFLPGGVVATYLVEGSDVRLFFSTLDDETAAVEAFALLRDHETQWGEIRGEFTDIGDGGFRFNDPGLGDGTVVRTGHVVAGVLGGSYGEGEHALLTALIQGLAETD